MSRLFWTLIVVNLLTLMALDITFANENRNGSREEEKEGQLCNRRWFLPKEVISHLQWNHIQVVYQKHKKYSNEDVEFECLSHKLHQSGIMTTIYTAVKDDNFQLLNTLWKHRDPDIYIVLSGRLPFIVNFLYEASDFDYEMENYRRTTMYSKSYWIVVPLLNENATHSMFYHLKLDNLLLLNSVEKVNCTEYELYTLMWRSNFTREFERLALPKTFAMNSTDVFFPNSKFGFNGREIVTSALEWDFYLKISDVRGKMIIDGGVCGELVKILSNALNFTHRVVSPADGKWGDLGPGENNTRIWTGIIGQVQQGEADTAMAPLTIEASRAEAVDFTTPFLIDHSRFMVRVPDPNDLKWKIYLRPFSVFIYVCLLLIVFTCGALVYVLENNFSRNSNKTHKIPLMDTILFFYGALILQAGTEFSMGTCTRVVVCWYWLACVSITAVYCGCLVASMAIIHTEKMPFQTVEELVAQSEYKWGYTGGTYRDVAFKMSALSAYNKLYEGAHEFYQKDRDVLSKDPSVHIQKVAHEKFVYIAGYYDLRKVTCKDYRFVLSAERFLADKMAFAFPKGSSLTDIFSKKLVQLRDGGVLSHIEKKYITPDNCTSSILLRKGPLTIEDVQGAFYILSLGTVISLLTLSIECVINKVKTNNIIKYF